MVSFATKPFLNIVINLCDRTLLVYSLKCNQSASLAGIFPNLCQASLYYSSSSYNRYKTCQHDHHLKHVCPDYCFQTTLKNPICAGVSFTTH